MKLVNEKYAEYLSDDALQAALTELHMNNHWNYNDSRNYDILVGEWISRMDELK